MKPKISIVSEKPGYEKRAKLLANALSSDLLHYPSAEKLEESNQGESISIVICHAKDSMTQQEIAAQVQVAKYAAAKAYIIVILSNRMPADLVEFVKKSGADSIISENEFENTSLPDFLCTQKLSGEFLPVKASEIFPDKELPMSIYHLMPLNRKFVPMFNKGTIVPKDRHEKMKAVGEFYIHRDDIDAYQTYVDKNQDLSAAGLLGRCRAKYMNLTVTYKKLVQLLTDQSQVGSFQEGKNLSEQCYRLASELITSLSSVGESWDVINNSSMDEMTAVDRAPAIASIAGLMSLMCSIGQPEEVMVAAMLADIGLLDLPPGAFQKFQTNGIDGLNETEKEIYYRHPMTSVNKVLSRKIPLPDKMKLIITSTHERADGKGFPNKPAKGPPQESMLIQFAEKIDMESKVVYGRERRVPALVRRDTYRREFDGGCFSLDFMTKIKPVCQEPKVS